MIKKKVAYLVVSAVIFIAALLLCVAVSVQLIQSSGSVMHTHRLIESLISLSADLSSLESDMRGYIITGAPVIAARFADQRAAVEADMTAIRELSADDSTQSHNAKLLSKAVDRKVTFCQRTEDLYTVNQNQSLALARSGRGADLMADVQNVRDRMVGAERMLLDRRSGDIGNAELMLVPAILLLACAGLAMLAICAAVSRSLLHTERACSEKLDNARFDLQRSQAEVSQLNENLQSHVRQLEVARDKALESSSLKSAFVANISHEIRTPLSGIIGMNELLLDTELAAEQRSLAETVHDSSLSLLAVLNDILDLSKIEAGKMALEMAPFDIRLVIDESVRLMAAASRSKGLDLHQNYDSRTPTYVIGDAERVRQVLLNLIGNAVKFTDHGSVTVQTMVESSTDGIVNLRISVSDTGIGISDEDKHYLFSPFSQLDNKSTRRFGGTGLGLAICKRLVTAMNGKIDVASKPGVGSTFTFSLPFQKSTGVEKPALLRPVRGRNQDHKCVLVVEDNPVLQQVAVMQLTSLGLSSRVARTGAEAIEYIKGMSFDLILMDVHLPKMSGFEATRTIRDVQSKHGQRTPIVAMTAGAMEGDREKCLEAGMDDYLSKPVSIDMLRRMTDKWLGSGGNVNKSA